MLKIFTLSWSLVDIHFPFNKYALQGKYTITIKDTNSMVPMTARASWNHGWR